jgi:hypothetical protein
VVRDAHLPHAHPTDLAPIKQRGGTKDGDKLGLALHEDGRQCLELARALSHRTDGLSIAQHPARLAFLVSLGGGLHQSRRKVDLGACESILAPLLVTSLTAKDAARRDACCVV